MTELKAIALSFNYATSALIVECCYYTKNYGSIFTTAIWPEADIHYHLTYEIINCSYKQCLQIQQQEYFK